MGGGPRIVHETLRGPNLVKELAVAVGVAIIPAAMWKKSHRDMKRKRQQFYDMLDSGAVSVVVDE